LFPTLRSGRLKQRNQTIALVSSQAFTQRGRTQELRGDFLGYGVEQRASTCAGGDRHRCYAQLQEARHAIEAQSIEPVGQVGVG
jgi:hypothetical protein